MPVRMATVLTFHSSFICSRPGLYAPAVKEVKPVATTESHIMIPFCSFDHKKGDVYLVKSGGEGGGGASGLLGVIDVGCGSSVSNVR